MGGRIKLRGENMRILDSDINEKEIEIVQGERLIIKSPGSVPMYIVTVDEFDYLQHATVCSLSGMLAKRRASNNNIVLSIQGGGK
jgi:hypothetical protein